MGTTGMGWRLYVDLVKQSGVAWVEDRAPTMGAALAFYSAFSLAPLLIIVIAVAGAVFGVDAARGAIVGQIAGLVGAPAAEAIQSLLKAAQETTTSIFATVVGLVTMLVGATTILVELQDDLDLHMEGAQERGQQLVVDSSRADSFVGHDPGSGLSAPDLAGFERRDRSIRGLLGIALSRRGASAPPPLEPRPLGGRNHGTFRDVVQVAAERTDRLERRMDGRVHHGHSVQRGAICNRPLPWSERNRISLRRSRYAGRAPVMALLLCASVLARRRVHLPVCNTPRALSKSCVHRVGAGFDK